MQLTFFLLYGTFLSELDGQRILDAGHIGLIAFGAVIEILFIVHR